MVGNPERIYSTRIFDVCKQQVELSIRNYRAEYFLIQCPDWMNVLPLTKEGNVVLIRQARPAIALESIEIPGGIIEAGEDPMEAAKRELQEETGYACGRIESLGFVHPNPAINTNRCHMFVAFDCEPIGAQGLDPGEDIEVFEVTIQEAMRLIDTNEFTHALSLNAWTKFYCRYPNLWGN